MHQNHIAKTELQESTIYLSKDGEGFVVTTFRNRKPVVRLTCESKSFALRVFFDQIEKEERLSESLSISA